MTQVFTGYGLGLEGSSQTKLGSLGPAEAGRQGNTKLYVNAANGNLVLQQKDSFLACRGLNLSLFETYNSQASGSSSPWHFNLDSGLSINGALNQEGSFITRKGADGHETRFNYNKARGLYLSESNLSDSISCNNASFIYKTAASALIEHYDSKGLLTSLKDADGNSVTLSYAEGKLSKIIDSSGKQETHWLFSGGWLTKVETKSEGKLIDSFDYAYDSLGRLLKL